MTGNLSEAISLDDAVDRMMTEDTASEEVTEDAAEEEEGAEPEEGEPTLEAEEAGDDDETESDEDTGDDADPVFEIETVNGVEQVPLSELKAGHMRQADYTRKTMELATERRDFASEKQTIEAQKQQLTEALQYWAVPVQQEPDWREMAQKLDPREFQLRQVEWQERQKRAQQAQEQYQALRDYEMQQVRQAEQQKLLEALPEWRDPARFKAEAGRMVEHAAQYGFAPEEVGAIVDHRMVRVLRDAILYREQQAKLPEAKRIAKPQKALKPGSKPDKARSQEVARKQHLDRLRQTGSIEDAIDLI